MSLSKDHITALAVTFSLLVSACSQKTAESGQPSPSTAVHEIQPQNQLGNNTTASLPIKETEESVKIGKVEVHFSLMTYEHDTLEIKNVNLVKNGKSLPVLFKNSMDLCWIASGFFPAQAPEYTVLRDDKAVANNVPGYELSLTGGLQYSEQSLQQTHDSVVCTPSSELDAKSLRKHFVIQGKLVTGADFSPNMNYSRYFTVISLDDSLIAQFGPVRYEVGIETKGIRENYQKSLLEYFDNLCQSHLNDNDAQARLLKTDSRSSSHKILLKMFSVFDARVGFEPKILSSDEIKTYPDSIKHVFCFSPRLVTTVARDEFMKSQRENVRYEQSIAQDSDVADLNLLRTTFYNFDDPQDTIDFPIASYKYLCPNGLIFGTEQELWRDHSDFISLIRHQRVYSKSDYECVYDKIKTYALNNISCFSTDATYDLKISTEALSNGDLKISPVLITKNNNKRFYLGREMAANVCRSYGLSTTESHLPTPSSEKGFIFVILPRKNGQQIYAAVNCCSSYSIGV